MQNISRCGRQDVCRSRIICKPLRLESNFHSSLTFSSNDTGFHATVELRNWNSFTINKSPYVVARQIMIGKLIRHCRMYQSPHLVSLLK
jgi:hypothetical protein